MHGTPPVTPLAKSPSGRGSRPGASASSHEPRRPRFSATPESRFSSMPEAHSVSANRAARRPDARVRRELLWQKPNFLACPVPATSGRPRRSTGRGEPGLSHPPCRAHRATTEDIAVGSASRQPVCLLRSGYPVLRPPRTGAPKPRVWFPRCQRGCRPSGCRVRATGWCPHSCGSLPLRVTTVLYVRARRSHRGAANTVIKGAKPCPRRQTTAGEPVVETLLEGIRPTPETQDSLVRVCPSRVQSVENV